MRLQDFNNFEKDYQMIKTLVKRIEMLNNEIARLESLTSINRFDETKNQLFAFTKESETDQSNFINMNDAVNKFVSYKMLLLKEIRSELIDTLSRFNPVMLLDGVTIEEEGKDNELESLIRKINTKISTISNIEHMKRQNLGLNYPDYNDLVNEIRGLLNTICEKEGLSLSD